MQLFFINFEFFPIFWKIQNFDFFFRIYFLMKISEKLSTYSSYEYFQLKNTKSAMNASRNAAKNL